MAARLLSNPALIAAVLFTFALQIAVVYLPLFQTLLGTTAMPARDLLVAVLSGATVLVAVEGWKWVFRSRAQGRRGSQPSRES